MPKGGTAEGDQESEEDLEDGEGEERDEESEISDKDQDEEEGGDDDDDDMDAVLKDPDFAHMSDSDLDDRRSVKKITPNLAVNDHF